MRQAHKLRESIERKLDQWEVRADAFESALARGRSEVLAEVEHAKAALGRAASLLTRRVDDSKDLAEASSTEVKRALEHLQVQLALGKAETRDALAAQRKQVEFAIRRAEGALERNLQRLDEQALEGRLALIEAADRAEARLEVAELYMEEELESAKLGLTKGGRALEAALARVRAGLEERRRGTGERASRFEHEMSDAFSHIRKAFRELVS